MIRGALFALLAGLTLAGCSSSSHDPAAPVEVAGKPVEVRELSHWMTVLSGGRAITNPLAPDDRSLRREALEWLIATAWIKGVTRERQIAVGGNELVRQEKLHRAHLFPGGSAEQEEFMRITRESAADISTEALIEALAAKLRAVWLSAAAPVSRTEVTSFYNTHRELYSIPERRSVELTNRKTPAEAAELKERIEQGERFSSVAQGATVERLLGRNVGDFLVREAFEKAVFSAKPRTLMGPVKLRNDYVIFEVTSTQSARRVPIGAVEDEISSKLDIERRSAALTHARAAWIQLWRGRTRCAPAYTVSLCRNSSSASSSLPAELQELE